jgi:hypothetical protein
MTWDYKDFSPLVGRAATLPIRAHPRNPRFNLKKQTQFGTAEHRNQKTEWTIRRLQAE